MSEPARALVQYREMPTIVREAAREGFLEPTMLKVWYVRCPSDGFLLDCGTNMAGERRAAELARIINKTREWL